MPNPSETFYDDKIINVSDIDTEFPVPGQDNDSQGFRDNFTVIDGNFVAVKARLEDLETNTLRLDNDNVFTQSASERIVIEDAHLKTPTLTKSTYGQQNGTVTLDMSAGDFQTITLTGTTTLQILSTSTPDSGVYQKIILEVTSSGDSTLNWDSGQTFKFDQESNSVFWNAPNNVIANEETRLFEIWTHQGSTTFYVKYLGNFA